MANIGPKPSLGDQIKMAKWLRENWDKVIVAQNLNAKQVRDLLSAQCGKQISRYILMQLLSEAVPGANFQHALKYPGGPTKATAVRDEMLKRIEALESEVKRLWDGMGNFAQKPTWQ